MSQSRPYLNVSFHHPDQRVNISVVADKMLVHAPRGDSGGGKLVFLSVLGAHSAVRGILAAAVTQREIRCDLLSGVHCASGPGGRIMTAPLTKAIVHGVFLGPEFSQDPDRTFDRAVLDPTPDKVVETLKRAFPVPALPEWNGWIYEALKKANCIQTLTGQGASGCLVSVWEDRLDQLIAQGVKTGAIRF